MDYEKRIEELLEKNLSENAFVLWSGINKKLPNIWKKYVASTLKYHKRADGSVPDIAEHTFEMLYAAVKVFRMFNPSKKDSILLSIALHDALKYGINGKGKNGKHTFNDHDRLIADLVAGNEKTFRKILDEKEFKVLVESLRFHSGKWSTDVKDQNSFDFNDFSPEVLFLHTLDMLSSNDCLKFPVQETNSK